MTVNVGHKKHRRQLLKSLFSKPKHLRVKIGLAALKLLEQTDSNENTVFGSFLSEPKQNLFEQKFWQKSGSFLLPLLLLFFVQKAQLEHRLAHGDNGDTTLELQLKGKLRPLFCLSLSLPPSEAAEFRKRRVGGREAQERERERGITGKKARARRFNRCVHRSHSRRANALCD